MSHSKHPVLLQLAVLAALCVSVAVDCLMAGTKKPVQIYLCSENWPAKPWQLLQS